MMRPQASWVAFRRLHLNALVADWRRTLLSVIGVCIGVSVVVGVLLLKSEMLRPFDSFGPALVHAADRGVVQVTPRVSGRLPVETVDRLRAEVPGAQAVIPVVAELTPVAVGGVSHGYLLLGGSCQVELLIGPFGCDPHAAAARPDRTIPLEAATVIAHQNGLRPGADLSFPGLPPNAAKLVSTFADFGRVVGPAVRLVRDGPLTSMASFGGVQHIRTISWWPLGIGLALLIGSVVLLTVFRQGSLTLDAGSDGTTVGLLGVAFATVSIAPRAAALLIRSLTAARPDIGRLLGADVRRYGVLFAISAAVLALGASLAIGSQSMQMLGTGQVAGQKAALLPNTLVISPQSVLDQSNGHISDAIFGRIGAVADGRPFAARWQSKISTGPSTRLVVGVTPGDWYSAAEYRPDGDDAATWQGLRAGDVALSRIAATRLHATVGDTVALPTVSGVRNFRVAGLFRPRIISDNAVGDIVLTSAEVARHDWAAVRDQVAIEYRSPAEASAHRTDFLDLGGDLSVYDDEYWRTVARAGVNRFFEPFTATGYVVMAAAGLSVLNVFVLGLVQRRRERAVLRAIGVTQRQEQAVVLAHASLLALLVAVAGGLGGIGLTYLQSLGSPVNYGIEIAWGLPASPLITGVAVLAALIATATIYPVIHTRQLEIAAELHSTA